MTKKAVARSITFTIAAKIIKISWNKFNKDVNNVYNENYKTLHQRCQKLEKFSMLTDLQNEYHQIIHTPEGNLQIQ